MVFDFRQRLATPINNEPIEALLASLQMQSAFFTASHLYSPWGMAMPRMQQSMMFHLLLEGEASFAINDECLSLKAGDFVLLPRGEGHHISDGICRNFIPLEQLPIVAVTKRYETLTLGNPTTSSVSCRMVCGALLFQHPLALKLLGVLPAYVVMRAEQSVLHTMVLNISELLKTETQNLDIGAEAMIARLADILVLAALRQYLTTLPPEQTGWFGSLADQRITQALRLIQQQPAKHWTLAELAQEVAMSRTRFAQQFKRLLGNTPTEYLTQWRMSLACSRLQSGQDTVLAIALDVGYQSESAFSRAFKKAMGMNPREWRQQPVA